MPGDAASRVVAMRMLHCKERLTVYSPLCSGGPVCLKELDPMPPSERTLLPCVADHGRGGGGSMVGIDRLNVPATDSFSHESSSSCLHLQGGRGGMGGSTSVALLALSPG